MTNDCVNALLNSTPNASPNKPATWAIASMNATNFTSWTSIPVCQTKYKYFPLKKNVLRRNTLKMALTSTVWSFFSIRIYWNQCRCISSSQLSPPARWDTQCTFCQRHFSLAAHIRIRRALHQLFAASGCILPPMHPAASKHTKLWLNGIQTMP